jgi:hypothetical protein
MVGASVKAAKSLYGHAESQQQAALTAAAAGSGDGGGSRKEAPPLHPLPTYLVLPLHQPGVHLKYTGARKPSALHRTSHFSHDEPAQAANQPDTHKGPTRRAAGNHGGSAGYRWSKSGFNRGLRLPAAAAGRYCIGGCKPPGDSP